MKNYIPMPPNAHIFDMINFISPALFAFEFRFGCRFVISTSNGVIAGAEIILPVHVWDDDTDRDWLDRYHLTIR